MNSFNANITSDGILYLYDTREGRPIFTFELDWKTRMHYWWWRFNYPPFSPDRPRATWAQIVQALRISDALTLVANKLNSDTIPSGIDVPIQRIKLVQLGRLAFALGCANVELNVETRYVRS
jgi:hypothetical protein